VAIVEDGCQLHHPGQDLVVAEGGDVRVEFVCCGGEGLTEGGPLWIRMDALGFRYVELQVRTPARVPVRSLGGETGGGQEEKEGYGRSEGSKHDIPAGSRFGSETVATGSRLEFVEDE
jgi:hypothetical protein